LVQVYVDDIIFGSSNLQLCREFEALMYGKFQMSAMSELNFFLGLHVLQNKDDIFLSQDKLLEPDEVYTLPSPPCKLYLETLDLEIQEAASHKLLHQ
nr:putative ribonuclease H-like domain-containing protein [Tanacetum cinerariifolium]